MRPTPAHRPVLFLRLRRQYNCAAGTHRLTEIRIGSVNGSVESRFAYDPEGRLHQAAVGVARREIINRLRAGGGCRGEWRGNGPDLAGMAAHETGHILRLDDQYQPDGT